MRYIIRDIYNKKVYVP